MINTQEALLKMQEQLENVSSRCGNLTQQLNQVKFHFQYQRNRGKLEDNRNEDEHLIRGSDKSQHSNSSSESVDSEFSSASTTKEKENKFLMKQILAKNERNLKETILSPSSSSYESITSEDNENDIKIISVNDNDNNDIKMIDENDDKSIVAKDNIDDKMNSINISKNLKHIKENQISEIEEVIDIKEEIIETEIKDIEEKIEQKLTEVMMDTISTDRLESILKKENKDIKSDKNNEKFVKQKKVYFLNTIINSDKDDEKMDVHVIDDSETTKETQSEIIETKLDKIEDNPFVVNNNDSNINLFLNNEQTNDNFVKKIDNNNNIVIKEEIIEFNNTNKKTINDKINPQKLIKNKSNLSKNKSKTKLNAKSSTNNSTKLAKQEEKDANENLLNNAFTQPKLSKISLHSNKSANSEKKIKNFIKKNQTMFLNKNKIQEQKKILTSGSNKTQINKNNFENKKENDNKIVNNDYCKNIYLNYENIEDTSTCTINSQQNLVTITKLDVQSQINRIKKNENRENIIVPTNLLKNVNSIRKDTTNSKNNASIKSSKSKLLNSNVKNNNIEDRNDATEENKVKSKEIITLSMFNKIQNTLRANLIMSNKIDTKNNLDTLTPNWELKSKEKIKPNMNKVVDYELKTSANRKKETFVNKTFNNKIIMNNFNKNKQSKEMANKFEIKSYGQLNFDDNSLKNENKNLLNDKKSLMTKSNVLTKGVSHAELTYEMKNKKSRIKVERPETESRRNNLEKKNSLNYKLESWYVNTDSDDTNTIKERTTNKNVRNTHNFTNVQNKNVNRETCLTLAKSLGFNAIPFVVGQSTSRSYHIGLNIQQTMALMNLSPSVPSLKIAAAESIDQFDKESTLADSSVTYYQPKSCPACTMRLNDDCMIKEEEEIEDVMNPWQVPQKDPWDVDKSSILNRKYAKCTCLPKNIISFNETLGQMFPAKEGLFSSNPDFYANSVSDENKRAKRNNAIYFTRLLRNIQRIQNRYITPVTKLSLNAIKNN